MIVIENPKHRHERHAPSLLTLPEERSEGCLGVSLKGGLVLP